MWKLVIEDDEGKRTVVHLTRDQYTVGRKEGNAIRLTERNISRDHARLAKTEGSDGSYVLEDLDAYNGVFVNGMRISKAQEMIHGDLIQIGDYRVVIQDDALEEVVGTPTVPDPEDLKATLVPGKVRARGTMLLERPNRFVMLVGPTPGAEYPLDKELITIGRAEDATISVNHNSVSRMHCEIHKLAEGRYEIVDNGSSNGVRVNGSDLSRGIVEAGDIIELGDVRFRFVAAGQVFLANASDSQQLAAITDRQADGVLGARKSSIAPFVVLGLLLGGAAVAGVYFLTRPASTTDVVTPASSDGTGSGSSSGSSSGFSGSSGNGAVSAPTSTAIPEAEKSTLADARRLVLTNPEAAHEKLVAGIGTGSAARTSADFVDIENKWAEDVFARAEKERDRDTAIGMLKEVADAPTVSDAQRAKASQLIQARAAVAPGSSAATPTSATPGAAAGSGKPKTGTTPAAPVGKASAADRARELMRQQDYRGARSVLEPIVKRGSASYEEISVLKSICGQQKDQVCIEDCKKRLAASGK